MVFVLDSNVMFYEFLVWLAKVDSISTPLRAVSSFHCATAPNNWEDALALSVLQTGRLNSI